MRDTYERKWEQKAFFDPKSGMPLVGSGIRLFGLTVEAVKRMWYQAWLEGR